MQNVTKKQQERAERLKNLRSSPTLLQTYRKLLEHWYNHHNADDYSDKDALVQETDDIAAIMELVALEQTEGEVAELQATIDTLRAEQQLLEQN